MLFRSGAAAASIGRGILWLAPWLMRVLSIAGTAAMFLVGGGILSHGVAPVQHAIETIAAGPGAVAGIGGVLKVLVTMALDGLIGIVAGAIVLGVVLGYRRVFGRKKDAAAKD